MFIILCCVQIGLLTGCIQRSKGLCLSLYTFDAFGRLNSRNKGVVVVHAPCNDARLSENGVKFVGLTNWASGNLSGICFWS